MMADSKNQIFDNRHAGGGIVTRTDLTSEAKKVTLVYRGKKAPITHEGWEIEADVYEGQGGIPPCVVSICPGCRNQIRIDGTVKTIDYDAQRGLFIEPFKCPWEASSLEHGHSFGGMCGTVVEYTGFTVRDA